MVETTVASDDADPTPVAGSVIRQPGLARGPSAHAYLLIVLGDHVLGRADAAWTQTLVKALGLIGFEEKAVRNALTRSVAAGYLTRRRAGRRTRWHLTPAGRDSLTAGKHRLFAAGPEQDWDGEWLILLTTVPEDHRNLRHRLRTALGWAGFGSLAPGLWISPHPSRAPETRQVLAALGEPVHGTLLHARLDDPEERHRMVSQAWDVSDIDPQYREFIARFTAARPETPGTALVQHAHLVYQWRRLLLADPGLPPSLLPGQWSGERARQLLLDRHNRWLRLARSWWRDHEPDT